MSPTTFFSDPAAVDAWDNCFRWRDGSVLHDLTIDSTWRRVSGAIAAAEGTEAAVWAQRFFDAFSSWRLLPDQRLLRVAGTGGDFEDLQSPCAVLNAAAFISSPGTRLARFERSQFVDTCELAVRLLDDVLLGSGADRKTNFPRIGLVGLADALHLLRLDYDSQSARQSSGEMAAALAEGTLRGCTSLALQRGAADCDMTGALERWRRRGAAGSLLLSMQKSGLRHAQLTAIEPQPTLALLANNASDAVDPRVKVRTGSETQRSSADGASAGSAAEVPLRAQIELRAAMQPWIDAAIDYPLVCASEPDPETMAVSGRLASARGLPPVVVRLARPAKAAGITVEAPP